MRPDTMWPGSPGGRPGIGGAMSGCMVCGAVAAVAANGYCLRCWDASENFAVNTFDGHGSYRDYMRQLAARYAA